MEVEIAMEPENSMDTETTRMSGPPALPNVSHSPTHPNALHPSTHSNTTRPPTYPWRDNLNNNQSKDVTVKQGMSKANDFLLLETKWKLMFSEKSYRIGESDLPLLGVFFYLRMSHDGLMEFYRNF